MVAVTMNRFLHLPLLLLWLLVLTTANHHQVSSLKINKETVDMLNTGVKALISIRKILATIKSVNELSSQAFPNWTSKQRSNLLSKLFGKLTATTKSSSPSVQRKFLYRKRNFL